MKLSSPEFADGGRIPVRYTCDGENVNPPLAVAEVPAEAVELALIVDDPDAVGGRTFVHWVVSGIPVVDRIEADSVPGHEGATSFGRPGYGGPCPPSGTHRYFFKLYALDRRLEPGSAPDKAGLSTAMRGHVLAEAALVGLYSRPGRG
ncbi:MAG TPA: YbhB/YbcL family Raf kinase inhibitor-like protein [bacterium]|nr:YbhB/YbcL family Raf kinase inhibitor-like protein [bacterium]HPQ66248.1 YbhB/YbcL family Raf kinase inhibitor-like protein [bacterium]